MVGEIISAGIGLVAGILIGAMVSPLLVTNELSTLQEHMAAPEWQTVEAWGEGYAQGFRDSQRLCRDALHRQREMILEQMEPTLPGWNSKETPGSGTDRHGVTLLRPWGPTLP